MNLRTINSLCFATCILCIVTGMITALAMIWTPGVSESLWRLLATIGVVFFGAASTLSVSKAFGDGNRPDGE
jgi:hypothetical protein